MRKITMKITKYALTITLICSAILTRGQEDWELKKDVDGIKVYTRYAGDSDIKEFRAEAVMDGSLSSFVAVIRDIPSYPELFANNISADLLDETDTTLLYYSRTAAPWPLKDRDGVFACRFSQHYGSKAVTVEINSVEGIRPPDEKHVRITEAKGFWKFFPVEYDKVEVILQMQVDPGGNIPAWVVNMFLIDSPFKDMKNLRERVNMEQYADRKFNFLVEY